LEKNRLAGVPWVCRLYLKKYMWFSQCLGAPQHPQLRGGGAAQTCKGPQGKEVLKI